MADPRSNTQSRTARWGWRVLLVVATLFGLNGVGWIFFGPDASLSNMADNMGVSVGGLEDSYPLVADAVRQEARRVAVYLAAIGAMAMVAALAGLRRARWAGQVTWVFIATTVGLFLVGLSGGLGVFGATNLFLAAVALTGQMMTRRAS